MIPRIAFKGTYKVSSRDNSYNKFWDFHEFAYQKKSDDVHVRFQNSSRAKNVMASCTLIVPDVMDKDIEKFCTSRGINFKKLKTKSLLKPTVINNRVLPPSKNKIKTMVDVDKLQVLLESQGGNISHCEDDYNKYYKSDIQTALKSGDPITATTMSITGNTLNNQALLGYIKKYGPDGLSQNQLRIDFNRDTDEPDHCMFFALKEIGMKDIPVYVNHDTYQIGTALGIFE